MTAINPFVGIDLTSSPNKPSAYAALDANLNTIALGFLGADREIIAAIDEMEPIIVAIDAPLSLPRGLCCLEGSCPCQPLSAAKGRDCERELARLGIPCFFTTKKSIIKEMVYRGIALKEELSSRGFEVIEVYPYATKVLLFGKPIPPKVKPIGVEFLRNHLVALIPALTPHLELLSHDLCDAVVAAYTGYLYHLGHDQVLGDPEEGLIHIPG